MCKSCRGRLRCGESNRLRRRTMRATLNIPELFGQFFVAYACRETLEFVECNMIHFGVLNTVYEG